MEIHKLNEKIKDTEKAHYLCLEEIYELRAEINKFKKNEENEE